MSVCEPLIQGIGTSTDKTRQRIVHGGLISNAGRLEVDDQNPCRSATNSSGALETYRTRNALIYIGVNAFGKAMVQGVQANSAVNIQSEKSAGVKLSSTNVTGENVTTSFDSHPCTIDIESIPARSFSAVTSAFSTKVIGEPEKTIFSKASESNDFLLEESNSARSPFKAQIDEANAVTSCHKEGEEEYKETDSEQKKKEPQLQKPEAIITETAIGGNVLDADEIKIDLEEEIETAAFSEQFYSSMARSAKLFDRPLIEDVILEECELEECEQQSPSNHGTACAINAEYKSAIMQRLCATKAIDEECRTNVNKHAEQPEETQNVAPVNVMSANMCRFEDSPLYQSSENALAKPEAKQSLLSARGAFFRDLDTRITDATSPSLENDRFNKSDVRKSTEIKKHVQEPLEIKFKVPRTPNSTPRQQEEDKDSTEKLFVSFQTPKCEELVAQRITDSALLSGIAEAVKLSNVGNRNSHIRFFPNESFQDCWQRQTDVRAGSDDAHLIQENVEKQQRIQPTNKVVNVNKQQQSQTLDFAVSANTQAKTKYQFNDLATIRRDFTNSKEEKLPPIVYTCSVSRNPLFAETGEDLVKNFNNLLNDYQSQPHTTHTNVVVASTVKDQERASMQPARMATETSESSRNIWENPDLRLSNHGGKLSNGFVSEKMHEEKMDVDKVRHDANCQSKDISPRKTGTTQIITVEQQQNQEQQQRQQLKERYQRELLQQQQIRQKQQLQQQQELPIVPLSPKPDLSRVLTVSTVPVARSVKSPTPTFDSLRRQNLLQNQYAYSPSSLSPRTLSRINHLNVIMESKIEKDGAEVIHNHPVFVKDTSKYWYKPNITREEAINMLKQKPPGTFVVRDSNSFPGAFGLALKVARPPPNAVTTQNGGDASVDLVRHFLIEPSPKGVKLKGCANEPVFGTLAALVYQHSITPLALPCKLLLPEYDPALSANEQQQRLDSNQALLERGAACNVTYLCSVDTESLTGPEALRRAAAWSLEYLTRGTLRAIPVHFKVSAQGITLTDNTRSQFFRRHYTAHLVTFAGIDPENRVFDNNNCSQLPPCYVLQAPIFGFVARKYVGGCVENACHVFAELDPDQPASAVVRFITNVMMPQAKNQQIAQINSQR